MTNDFVAQWLHTGRLPYRRTFRSSLPAICLSSAGTPDNGFVLLQVCVCVRARCTQVFRGDVNVMLQASFIEFSYVFVDTSSRI